MKYTLLPLVILAAAVVTSPARAWKQKEFVVSFWWPPPPAETTPERYAQIRDAGFTAVMAGNGIQGPELSGKMLDLSRQYKLKAFVSDGRISGGQAGNVPAVVKEYAGNPALEGYLLQDEPSAAQFPALRDTVAALRKADGKRLAFINLLPTYATPAQLGTPTYEEYVKQYLDTVKPEVLCFDHYPFLTSGERPDYLENLEITRRQALDHKVPFWTFTQAEGIEGAYRSPSEIEMRSQVFTDLAYGAKGILYFTYWTPDPGAEKHFDGILTADGKARGRYAWVTRLNDQIHTLAPLLMQMKSRGVYQILPEPEDDGRDKAKNPALPALPKGTKALSDPLFDSVKGGPATLGVFDGPDGKGFFWVVNRDTKASVKLSFDFNQDMMSQLFEHGLDGEVSNNLIRTDLKLPARYDVRLGPGEARLFEIPLVLR